MALLFQVFGDGAFERETGVIGRDGDFHRFSIIA
jgi:hypothetical protein